jgi:hypothetical protein
LFWGYEKKGRIKRTWLWVMDGLDQRQLVFRIEVEACRIELLLYKGATQQKLPSSKIAEATLLPLFFR